MIKVALSLSVCAFLQQNTAKNSNPELYNRFLFCNRILLFVRYLHALLYLPFCEVCSVLHAEVDANHRYGFALIFVSFGVAVGFDLL